MSVEHKKIPINIVMGQLGSGKTTVILSLVKQIAGDDCKVVWVKNEYGDVNVDGALAKEQGLKTEEIMNGCVCCTAIGRLEEAVKQVLELNPDRIILETAGTAHPAPIALELKRFSELQIDSFIEVIDALNFEAFDDHSMIRQSHNKYIDFIILNKIGLIDEKQLDHILDEILDIYPETPRIKTKDGSVSAEMILSLDCNKLASKDISSIESDIKTTPSHHVHVNAFSCKMDGEFTIEDVQKICESISKQDIYRIKGIVKTNDGNKVLNGVMNRFTWQGIQNDQQRTELLFIGPGANQLLKNKICEQLTNAKL
ncbi:MAG: GTP-binding protein [Patescibacteria group bacterium]|nr:GTP-binding protein [Patescibacteria group bacterium]